jgi:hypothetical protein
LWSGTVRGGPLVEAARERPSQNVSSRSGFCDRDEFIVQEVKTFLADHDVFPLSSPPCTPSYNDSVEARIGALEVRAFFESARHDRPGRRTPAGQRNHPPVRSRHADAQRDVGWAHSAQHSRVTVVSAWHMIASDNAHTPSVTMNHPNVNHTGSGRLSTASPLAGLSSNAVFCSCEAGDLLHRLPFDLLHEYREGHTLAIVLFTYEATIRPQAAGYVLDLYATHMNAIGLAHALKGLGYNVILDGVELK